MNKQTHEEFVKEVAEKTKDLTVPEESFECMREGYEHDPKVRGPRSRPEQVRRLAKTESLSVADHIENINTQQQNVRKNDLGETSIPSHDGCHIPAEAKTNDANCEENVGGKK